jgi:hypothetical protein
MATNVIKDFDSSEKRKLAEFPTLDLSQTAKNPRKNQIYSFPKKVDDFVNDNFTLRNYSIDKHKEFYFYFSDNAEIGEVLKGKDGWFEFYSGLTKNYWENGFSDGEITYWHEKLLARQKYFESKGIKFYTFIVPIKLSLMPEKFPKKYSEFPEPGSQKLIKYNKNLGNKLNLTGFKESLEKDPEKYYFKSDFHWNEDGGYEGYQQVYNELINNGVKMKKIEKDSCRVEKIGKYSGDLIQFMGIQNDSFVDQYSDKNSNHYLCDSSNIRADNLMSEYNLPTVSKTYSENSNYDKAVILRDSYVSYMSPFLAPSFSQIDMFSSPTFFENNSFDFIQKNKPDVVIQIFVESNMRRGFIQNNPEIDKFWEENRCKYIQC